MSRNPDRLYDLVPVVYRTRDAAQGYPLQALLRVIAEQAGVVEDDIAQLYENWFIETCQDWVVPYIGSLIGYTPVSDTGQPQQATARALTRERILIPRREVSNTIGFRRRKGTLKLLEQLAAAVAGWPSLAVEFYRLLGVTQNINYLHLDRGRTADVRDGRALERLGTAFDRLGRTIDVRRVDSSHSQGRYNIPEVGLFLWRLNTYSVTKMPAYCYEQESPNCYLFSVLGNDTPLYNNPQPATGSGLSQLNFPVPVSRRDLERTQRLREIELAPRDIGDFYGDGKSFAIWSGSPQDLVPPKQIVAADLTGWTYRPLPDQVAVDPRLGRIVFPPGHARKQGVWVSYHYAFSAAMGGGEYDRPQSAPPNAQVYLVGQFEKNPEQYAKATIYKRIGDALAQWQQDAPPSALIEILDSAVYTEPIRISLKANQVLKLAAANRVRPVIRLLEWQTSLPDDLTISGDAGSWFLMDGLLVTGRGMQVDGSMAGVLITHSTLTPGWGLECDCEPKKPSEPSLQLIEAPGCLRIEHSIVGPIRVDRDEVTEDPLVIHISDSIVDATSTSQVALGAPQSLCAYATLTIRRSTVFGQIQTQTIELAENSILMGMVRVCRRQKGCMRFCYVTPGSRAPRRFECQPDLVLAAVAGEFSSGQITAAERDALMKSEGLRVEPEFGSVRYGGPVYCQLARGCAAEITAGASDQSEMGVFHDLYQPQREANLLTRLNDYTPAGCDVGIIFAS